MSRRNARAALLLALAGCAAGGSETGNPALPMRIDLDARSSDPDAAAVAVSSGAAGTVIDEAWVAFGELAFLRGDECALLDDYDVEGPTIHVADLARAGARLTVEIAEGDYCGLVVPLMSRTTALPEDAPEELTNHSVVLRGRRDDGTPFLLMYPEQDELELAARHMEFAVDSGAADLLLSFDVAVWMRDVDLDAATVGDDGVIRIAAASNRPLLDAFERNLECSLELYADEDDDGTVSAEDPLLARCAPG